MVEFHDPQQNPPPLVPLLPPNHDLTSHFYIHPNENFSLVLISPVLNGLNYHACPRTFYISLEMKNKCGFIDGTIKKPNSQDSNFFRFGRVAILLSYLGFIIRLA